LIAFPHAESIYMSGTVFMVAIIEGRLLFETSLK